MTAHQRMVLPVFSAEGGVGRSTVAGVLAAALRTRTADASSGRWIAIADTAPRSCSPWPGWVDTTARRGVAARPALGQDWPAVARLLPDITSTITVGADASVAVWADTGPLDPAYLGAYPGPRWWGPLLWPAACGVIDGDAVEGHRIIRQAASGGGSSVGDWLSSPSYRTVAVLVARNHSASLGRALDVITAAEHAALYPHRRFIVVINDLAGRKLTPRAKARRELLRDRVAAITHLPFLGALAADTGHPPWADLAERIPDTFDELLLAVAGSAEVSIAPEPQWPADEKEAGTDVGARA